jgi:hypothetical protein
VYLSETGASISNNSITSNTASNGGGVYAYDSETAMTGAIVSGNTALHAGGAAYLSISDAVLINNIFANNYGADEGSGVYLEGGKAQLDHNTIARNTGGSAVCAASADWYGTTSRVTFTNTILVGHTVGISVAGGNTAALEATLWGDGTWANGDDWGGAGAIITGTHNFWGNPAFVDADTGDYHIGLGSAAIDEGVETVVSTDIDGQPRLGAPDLGADEYWAPGALKRVYLPVTLRS